MTNLDKVNIYSFNEMLHVIKNTIAHKILASVPKGLQSTQLLVDILSQKGIKIYKNKKMISFMYKINGNTFNFNLERNSSDGEVFRQVIINTEYQTVLDLIKKYKIPCNLMVDAGANIGLASIYFKSQFPQINIIALEPFSNSFEKLEKNIIVNKIDNIKLFKKGLWSHKTNLSADYSFRDKQDWAYRLVETSNAENATFEVLSVSDIIKDCNANHIDFLKIDIEGGEATLFGMNSDIEWLKQVRLIAIEIHDEFNCRDSIENTLVQSGFKLYFSEELTIGVNMNLLVNKN